MTGMSLKSKVNKIPEGIVEYPNLKLGDTLD